MDVQAVRDLPKSHRLRYVVMDKGRLVAAFARGSEAEAYVMQVKMARKRIGL